MNLISDADRDLDLGQGWVSIGNTENDSSPIMVCIICLLDFQCFENNSVEQELNV